MKSTKLVLSSGDTFLGQSPDWCDGDFFGEVVFTTGMVGYTETLSDPSFSGQIVTFTYPLIGNYGVFEERTWESGQIHAAGVVVSDLMDIHSRDQAIHSLEAWCKKHNVPIISGIDTRALTKVLRQQGVALGAIVPEKATVNHFENINNINLVSKVSVPEPIITGEGDKTIVVVDCGIKHNILRHLELLPSKIKRVSFNYDYTNENYDGVFLSNGPGDPEVCVETIEILKKAMQQDKPIFGICLGSQIMALASGAKTFKLKFGHRGQNHPCLQIGTDRCFLTSQNHGFAIEEDTLPEDWIVTYRNLNDDTIQGIKHKTKPFFSVQFHPEACPGPTDTAFLFEDFYNLL